MAYESREEFCAVPEPIFWRRLPGPRSPEEIFANIHARLSGKGYRELRKKIYEAWKKNLQRRMRLNQVSTHYLQWMLYTWDEDAMREHRAGHQREMDMAANIKEERYHYNYGYDQYCISKKNKEDSSDEEEEDEKKEVTKEKKGKRGCKSYCRDRFYKSVDVYFDRRGHQRDGVCYGECCSKDGRGVKHVTVKMPKNEKRKLMKQLQKKGVTREDTMRALEPALHHLKLKKSSCSDRLRVQELHLHNPSCK